LQGDAAAIRSLGELYHATVGFGTNRVVANFTNALTLHRLAADMGDKDAHFHLGYAYREGKTIPRSVILAFAHFKLSGPSPRSDSYLRSLVLEMSKSDLAEGEKEARNFKTVSYQQAFENLVFNSIRITGIFGVVGQDRMALINGRTTKAGDTIPLNLAGLPASVKCESIEQSAATVSFGSTRKLVNLKSQSP
jgi:hypothetical protein